MAKTAKDTKTPTEPALVEVPPVEAPPVETPPEPPAPPVDPPVVEVPLVSRGELVTLPDGFTTVPEEPPAKSARQKDAEELVAIKRKAMSAGNQSEIRTALVDLVEWIERATGATDTD